MRGLLLLLALALGVCSSAVAAPRADSARDRAEASPQRYGPLPGCATSSQAYDGRSFAQAASHTADPHGEGHRKSEQRQSGDTEGQQRAGEQWRTAAESLPAARAQRLRAAAALHDGRTPSMAGVCHRCMV